MTPKEKAQEIVEQMSDFIPRCDHNEKNLNIETIIRCAKQCALIAVDEILKYQDSLVGMLDTNDGRDIMFWEEIKKEINNL